MQVRAFERSPLKACLFKLQYRKGSFTTRPTGILIAFASHHFISIVEYIRHSSDIIRGDVFARLMPC